MAESGVLALNPGVVTAKRERGRPRKTPAPEPVAAPVQVDPAAQAGAYSVLLSELHRAFGLEIPQEQTEAIAGALAAAIAVTWPVVDPKVAAWANVGLLSAAVYGPHIQARMRARSASAAPVQAPAPEAVENAA